MPARQVLIAIFDAKADVEEALRHLAAAEVTLKSVSVVGHSHHVQEQLCGMFRSACGEVRYVGRGERFWNRLWEQLPGAAFLWVPAVGPLVFAGSLSAAVAGHASDADDGDGENALRSALLALGVPPAFGATCESALRGDRLVLVARTPGFQAARTYALLEQSRSLEIRAYPEPELVGAGELAAADLEIAERLRRDATVV